MTYENDSIERDKVFVYTLWLILNDYLLQAHLLTRR